MFSPPTHVGDLNNNNKLYSNSGLQSLNLFKSVYLLQSHLQNNKGYVYTKTIKISDAYGFFK